jgi:hypothetical protein
MSRNIRYETIKAIYQHIHYNQDEIKAGEVLDKYLEDRTAVLNSHRLPCKWKIVYPDGVSSWWESSCNMAGAEPKIGWEFCPFCGKKILKIGVNT